MTAYNLRDRKNRESHESRVYLAAIVGRDRRKADAEPLLFLGPLALAIVALDLLAIGVRARRET